MLNKVKKTSRGALVRKLDKLVSEMVRVRDAKCVVCGSTYMLQAGHLFTRTSYSTRWDLLNVHVQCAGCNFRHNGDAWPYTNWFIETYGKDKLVELHAKHRTIAKFKDWELQELYNQLKEQV